jgi:hypothetical protein
MTDDNSKQVENNDNEKTADEVVIEQRCVPGVNAKTENELRVIAKLNGRTCESEVGIAVEKRIAAYKKARDCQEQILSPADCKCIDY